MANRTSMTTHNDGIYLDHNATTPLLREIVEAMLPHLRTHLIAIARDASQETRVSSWQSVGAMSIPPGFSTRRSDASAPGRSRTR
jgi:hypothetical protein